MTACGWRRGTSAVVLALGAAVLSPATAATAPQCAVLAVSPGFATDKTVACYSYRRLDGGRKEVLVHVSRDGMRSWRQAASKGFSATPNTDPTQLFFVGRTLFLQTTDYGLLFSNDLADNFSVADAFGGSPNGRDNLTAVLSSTTALPGFPGVEIAYGDNSPHGAALIRPPLHQRVVGSTDSDVRFATYIDQNGERRWLSLAFRPAETPTASSQGAAVWDCDAALTCTERRAEFKNADPLDIVVAPDFAMNGVAFVTTHDISGNNYGGRLWRSTDGGRRFSEVAPVASLRRELASRRLNIQISTGVTFLGGRRVALRIESADDLLGSPATPVRQIFVSDDLGATWKRVAFGRSSLQRGARGNIPWNGMWGKVAQETGRIHVVAGRWFVLGSVDAVGRPYCSRDGGRTWKTYCD